MNGRQRSLIVILLCLASIQTATAKRLRFIRGCEITKLTEDADTCKLSPSANLWITIRPEMRDLPNEPSGQISYLAIKAENSGEVPINFDLPSKSYLKDQTSQIYRRLDPDDAIEQFVHRSAALVVGALLDPFSGTSETDATEKDTRTKYGANVLSPGKIPPKAFIEGVIFFELFKNDDGRKLELVVPSWPILVLEYQ